MVKGFIHTYMTVIGMISISEDGNGNVNGLYLPSCNLPVMEDRQSPVLDEAAEQVGDYFARRRKVFDLPLAMEGTEFQMKVWEAISEIPYGKTMTYSEIAEAVGNRNSYRAVGTACGANPLPVIIPCHRVISSSGIGLGYAGGSILKKRLLNMESDI